MPSEDLQLFVVEDDEEQPFSMHEPTVGSDRPLTADTWVPVATIDGYLVDNIYELWAEDDADVLQLSKLADHIREFDEARGRREVAARQEWEEGVVGERIELSS